MGKSSFINASLISNESGIDLISSLAPGSVFLNQVDEDIKNSRLYEVQELLRSQQLSFNKKSINSIIKVLVLKKGKKKHQYIGRSPFNQSVYFSSKNENLLGSFLDLNITGAFQNSLTGNILSDF